MAVKAHIPILNLFIVLPTLYFGMYSGFNLSISGFNGLLVINERKHSCLTNILYDLWDKLVMHVLFDFLLLINFKVKEKKLA